MTPQQIAFLEQVAQGPDKTKWEDIFSTLIDEVKEDVMAEKISVGAGNEAVKLLRDVRNKITILDNKPVNGTKNPAI